MIEGALLNNRALERAVKDLPEKLRTKALRESLRAKGKEVLADARKNAAETSRRLANTMKLRALKSKTRGTVGVKIETGTRQELGIPAEDRYYWPAAIELGTRYITPRAFMRRAIKKHEPTALDDIARLMRARVEGIIAAEIRRGLRDIR